MLNPFGRGLRDLHFGVCAFVRRAGYSKDLCVVVVLVSPLSKPETRRGRCECQKKSDQKAALSLWYPVPALRPAGGNPLIDITSLISVFNFPFSVFFHFSSRPRLSISLSLPLPLSVFLYVFRYFLTFFAVFRCISLGMYFQDLEPPTFCLVWLQTDPRTQGPETVAALADSLSGLRELQHLQLEMMHIELGQGPMI